MRERLEALLGAIYRIEGELSGGGMSMVFVAEELALGRKVVIKVLPPELAAGISAERFNQEIRLAARLQHPHIVPLLSAGEVDGLPYFTMPFVEGESLRQQLVRRGESPGTEAVRVLREVASALEYAHSMDIVHRDIKPDNVLLSHGSAMVTDLGVAKALNASGDTGAGLTALGSTLGTPAYMSPEQVAADPTLDHRSDIYSWGVMAYELLSGSTPFAGRNPQATLAAHATETPQSLALRRPGVNTALNDLVMRTLEKRPADRPQSAAALVSALDAIAAEQTPAAGLDARVPSRRSSAPRLVALAVAVAIVLALVVAVSLKLRARPAATGVQTIAVLPFVGVGPDSAQTYISDGMTDELAAALTKVQRLQVVARRSAFAFKGRNADPGTIGRALNAALLLDGTVRREGNRIRVTAQMTNAQSGFVMWSDRYEGDAKDVFALQDSIARAIVGALQLTLAEKASGELATTRTRSLAAHDLYLRGRFEAGKHSKAGLLAAVDLFQQSLNIDPAYPLPWVGIADAYGWLADEYLPATAAYPKAKAAALTAVRLAPTLADGHAVLTWVEYAYDWDFVAAEREGRLSVALDSGSALARSNYSYALAALGRRPEALEQIRRAVALEPLSASLSANLEWHLVMQRDYAGAIAQHTRTRTLDPTYYFSDSWAAIAYRELGRFSEALDEYARIEAVTGQRPFTGFVTTYARMGDTARARSDLAALIAHEKRSHVPPERIAQAYAAIGDRENAFWWLERALEERSNGMVWLPNFVGYDQLRTDSRFAALVRRITPSR